MYVSKCVGCIYLNGCEGDGTLPVQCPNLKMPCIVLEPDMVRDQSQLRKFIIELLHMDINKDVGFDVAKLRFPIDGENVDRKLVEQMLEAKKQDVDISTYKAY